MPVTIPFPYVQLDFDDRGRPRAGQLQTLLDTIDREQVTDLFVVSHGWNNDEREAHDLYNRLFARIDSQRANVPVDGRVFAVAGVIWPSKKFDAAEDDAGGAAAFGDGAANRRLEAQLDTLAATVRTAAARKQLVRAKALIPDLDESATARRQFAELVLRQLPASRGEEGDRGPSDGKLQTLVADDTLLSSLGRHAVAPGAGEGGGIARMGGAAARGAEPAGGAAGIGDIFGGIKGGAMSLLNLVTYYKMKDRAGVVGASGLNPALRAIRERFPALRLHLIGHSFGGRVVTSAVAGASAGTRARIDSLSLLQAAFSHHAFSGRFDRNKQGFFRSVVTEGCVRGPIIISHTRNDKAVGVAYALASRLAGQDASALGDPNDRFGGLGSNGARDTAEAVDSPDLVKAGGQYAPAIGSSRIHNLLADPFIAGHSAIANDDVAYAVLSAVAAT